VTLDLATLTQLVAVSGGVAVVVGAAKGAVRTWATPDERLERAYLRGLSLVLGVAAVGWGWGWTVVPISVGLLAGAASEVVYRWLLRELPGLLDRLRGG
jgi:hypothetical protein